MTPECWQRVDEIFQAAIELEAEERPAFVVSACAGDEELRREVDSLITADQQGLGFLEELAFQVAAGFLATGEPELVEGQCIGHYEIVGLIGRGGMGEVYLAKDNFLNRLVALKLLPAAYTRNKDRLRRFQQEAQAASALNHPNILTIHELGQVNGQYFIATEFVEGETLRQRIERAPLNLPEALDIAIQIGNGLLTAHNAGIIHRDIKPENIMLRGDGYIKVLDFGLAKLTETHEPPTGAQAAEQVNISSGLLMGTVKYMSPEQARGEQVDSRSDIFSFGVVLYEMVTGHAPFEGETTSALVAAIQRAEPAPLTKYLPQAEQVLQRIISKALRKDKVERYQTTEELLTDLRNLKAVFATSTVKYLLGRIKDQKTVAAGLIAALMLAALAISFGLYKYFKSRSAHFETISATMLTNTADAWSNAISPDGKYVVYHKGSGKEGVGKFNLWLRTVGTTNEVQIVPETEGNQTHVTFSPDGKSISYCAQLANQPVAAFVIPTFGGNATKLPLKRATHVSFSPDGKRLAYLHNRLAEGKTVVVIANADGSNERDIITRQAPNYYYANIKPSWSPDGKLIACVGQNGTESFPRIFVVNVETGAEKTITAQKWTNMRAIAWLPDMSGLLAVASEETSCIMQIWNISYPGGEARRITHDTVNYLSLDLRADGKTLVTSKGDSPTAILVMPVEVNDTPREKRTTLSVDIAEARQINGMNLSAGQVEASARLAWTPDGKRIVYLSEESGNADIWSMNKDGSDRRQLTTDQHWDTAAVVSPNGRYIAFMSNRAGAENIWLMDIDGGNQRRLTHKYVERHPVFSADSKWVYFTSWETGKATTWKIPVEGGEPTQVIADLSFSPALSPDGKLLSYIAQGKLFIAPAEGGAPLKSFDQPGAEYSWTPDGRALTFVWLRDHVVNLWAQTLDGSEPRQLTNFTSEGIFKYALSPDGKHLVVARRRAMNDLVLINDLK